MKRRRNSTSVHDDKRNVCKPPDGHARTIRWKRVGGGGAMSDTTMGGCVKDRALRQQAVGIPFGT